MEGKPIKIITTLPVLPLIPGQMESQINASLQNQNLCMDLQWVAKWICKSARKFMQVAKSRKFQA